MQSEYECREGAFRVVLERLTKGGMIVERPQIIGAPNFIEVKREREQLRGVWLFPNEGRIAGSPDLLIVHMHWVVKNGGKDKRAILRVASLIESILLEEGAVCTQEPVAPIARGKL